MLHRPLERAHSQSKTTRIEILKLRQRDDGLSHAVNIDRVCVVVKIPGGSVLADKMSPVKVEPAFYMAFELGALQTLSDGTQGAEIVARVKIVDPVLLRTFAVQPGAIRPLPGSRVPRHFKRCFHKVSIAGMFSHSAQQRRSQQIAVMDVAPRRRKRVRQPGYFIAVGPKQFLPNIVGSARRHLQTADLP